MSLLEVYSRALRYLAPAKRRVLLICLANIVLAMVSVAEPILFGRVIDSISDKQDVMPTLAFWAGLGMFNIIAFVLVARGADRLAHERRAAVLCRILRARRSRCRSPGTISAAPPTLCTRCCVRPKRCFSLWLEFLRQHLSTAVALVLLVPTAMSMDLACRRCCCCSACFTSPSAAW